MKKFAFIIALMVIHFLIGVYFNVEILGGIPHIPDSATYYRQGIMLSKGYLYLSNFTREPVEAFMPLNSFVREGKLFFNYPHFWPALLALSIKIGVPWMVNPLLSTISLLLIFLIAVKLFNRQTANIASVIYCFSLFAILMSGDYMTHSATQMFILAGIYMLLQYFEKQTVLSALLSGFFFGYAFDLRPVTALGVAFPLFLYAVIYHRKQIFKLRSSWLVLSGFIMLALFIADNALVSGSLVKAGNPIADSDMPPFAFSNLRYGLNQADSTLAFLSPVLFFSFIPLFVLALACIPLIVLRGKKDFLLATMFASLVVIYSFSHAMGIQGYGPRYYFEAVFALFILAARGIVWLLNQFSGARKTILAGILLLLLAYNIFWLVKILPQYEDYNWIRTEMFEKIKALDLENSIVIISGNSNWFEDGVTAALYDPDYKKSFFINRLPNNKHIAVVMENPGKNVYDIKNVRLLVELTGINYSEERVVQ